MKAEKISVSVVVPVYGDFCYRRAERAVESILCQKGVELEVIVVESGKVPKMASKKASCRRHVFLPSAGSDCFSPGRVRNAGLRAAQNDYVYVSDGDIILQRYSYLRCITMECNRRGNIAMRWPPMRRLLEREFEEFDTLMDLKGLKCALEELNRPNAYLASLSRSIPDLVVRTRKGRLEDYEDGLVFTTIKQMHDKYIEDTTLRGKEPLVYSQVRHIGGLLAPRTVLEAIGGYCEDYKVWGNEDIDIQWKIDAYCGIDFIPERNIFEVLHLDHPRGYFSPYSWSRNKSIFEDRKRGGVEKAILTDRCVFTAGGEVT